jgi:hypothetical protein
MPGEPESGDRFGYALAAGDFDGNNYDDLAIGVPFEDLGTDTDAGVVNVVYGRAGGLDAAFKVTVLHQAVDPIPSSPEDGDLFGFALAVGDFDGNSRDDLAIGVPGEAVGSDADAGVVNVVYSDTSGLNPAWTTHPAQDLHQGFAGMPDDAEAGDRFGAALTVGDFDSNGVTDLAIGVPGEDLGSRLKDVGVVMVVYSAGTSGLAAGASTDLFQAANPLGETVEGGAGEHYGTVLAAGRFDSGSAADLAFGVWGQMWDGNRYRCGYTVLAYSEGVTGLDPANTVEVEVERRCAQVYVDKNSTCPVQGGLRECTFLIGPYRTVAQGVTGATTGDVLHIRVGNYDEQLVFDKPLRITAYDGPAVIRRK